MSGPSSDMPQKIFILKLRALFQQRKWRATASCHRRNHRGEAVVGWSYSILDTGIEMAVAIFLVVVENGRCQRSPAAGFDEARRDLVLVAAESGHRKTLGEYDTLRPHDFAIDPLQRAVDAVGRAHGK